MFHLLKTAAAFGVGAMLALTLVPGLPFLLLVAAFEPDSRQDMLVPLAGATAWLVLIVALLAWKLA